MLGKDNVILASHSSDTDQEIGFTKLLTYKDGSVNSKRALDVSQLLLKEGDLMTVYQSSDQTYYTFKVSLIQGDDTVDHSVTTDLLADIEGKPQLTLYACVKVGDNEDGRLIVQADFVSSSNG